MTSMAKSLKKNKNIILLLALCFIHVSFCIFFYCLKYKVLTLYNCFSVIFYVFLVILYKPKRAFKILSLVSFEIPLYGIVATYYLGSNCGAFFFAFGMITAVFLFAVNMDQPLIHYILISIPSIVSVLVIILWQKIPVQGVEIENTRWFFIHRLYFLLASLIAAMYLCIDGQRELIDSKKKNIQYIKQLQYISNHDALTDSPNRRFFMNQIECYKSYSLVIFDIDDFKKINDKYGHHAGDKILVRICQRIKAILPKDTIFARWGGEEFVIAFTNSLDRFSIENILQDVRSVVCNTPFHLDEVVVTASITLGFAINKGDLSFGKVFSLADDALYKGKKSGKNTVVFAES